jgi:MFS transporter, BCD family, chlorophyll transporter
MLIGGTIVGAITIGILLKSLEINASIEQVQSQIKQLAQFR